MHKLLRKIRRAITLDEPGYYDMYLNGGERFNARLYLHHILRVLREQGMARPLNLLDAGCQAGRLAIPLAKEGHRVTGVDTSGVGLHKARLHARKEGAALELIRADLGRWLPKQAPGGFDAVLCNEVLYLRDNHRKLLAGLIRLIRPGGLCFISHRPPGFYQKETSGEGTVDGSYYNWQDRKELRRTYEGLGVEILEIVPVGLTTVNHEHFSEEQRDQLFRTELSLLERGGGDGRYLLVCGKKN